MVAVITSGIRDGKPFNAKHLFLSSHRRSPEAMRKGVKDRVALRSGTGSATPSFRRTPITTEGMVTRRWVDSELLRCRRSRPEDVGVLFGGDPTIGSGRQRAMHDIGELVAMAGRMPKHPGTDQGTESVLAKRTQLWPSWNGCPS